MINDHLADKLKANTDKLFALKSNLLIDCSHMELGIAIVHPLETGIGNKT